METKKIKEDLKKAVTPKVAQALRARDTARDRVKGFVEAKIQAEKDIATLKVDLATRLQVADNVLTTGKDPAAARKKVDDVRNDLQNAEAWLREVETRLPQAHQDLHAAKTALKDRVYAILKGVALVGPQATITGKLEEISEVIGAVDAAVQEIIEEYGERLDWDQRESLIPVPAIPDNATVWLPHFARTIQNR